MRYRLTALLLLLTAQATQAGIPATPVMTIYKFNGPFTVPFYSAEGVPGAGAPAGTLTQGTSVIPCLVIRDGKPLTDGQGTPYVGFEVVVDPRRASAADTQRFKQTAAERAKLEVQNHHCAPGVKNVIDVRQLYALKKPPFFDPPPRSGKGGGEGATSLDRIVRAFHSSPQCEAANRSLTGRRAALAGAWDGFIRANVRLGSEAELARAKHLDYVMRTALHEGHLKRGCNAYGTCERNVIALSIRNRAVGQCQRGKGCGFPGDFQGASSSVSQYNIWDEYLTQISGLTSCFMRPDLAADPDYAKLQAMYTQNVGDVERILYGSDADLAEIFPGTPLADLKELRHYYHAPAMGKCFPKNDRVEYISGAVASRGGDYALLADTRIQVGAAAGDGYSFKQFLFEERPEGDAIQIVDRYPDFVVDGRKVSLRSPASCPPYGVPAGCAFKTVGRYRKTPSWINQGHPVEITCRVKDRGESCQGGGSPTKVQLGGSCDVEMRPVSGVP
ncbi:hypothetical protein [uncultured Thiodictyon sp.]|uniref:hypothetical protein n=1 Tax=uncultured Thiodictyon sp. TaxID=1846217 RepID=UPI0025F742CC|nr:hypothetical protein [uncultured Thiodictyon sp.]